MPRLLHVRTPAEQTLFRMLLSLQRDTAALGLKVDDIVARGKKTNSLLGMLVGRSTKKGVAE